MGKIGKYHCDKCSKNFKNNSGLFNHLKKHPREIPKAPQSKTKECHLNPINKVLSSDPSSSSSSSTDNQYSPPSQIFQGMQLFPFLFSI